MDNSNNVKISQYLLPDRREMRVFAKVLPLAMVVFSVLVFGVIRYGDQRSEQALLKSLEKEEQQAAASMSRTVQQALFSTTASLQYLVLLIERNLAESTPVERIARTLLDFSETHPVFDQLRYLDMTGKEVVRIDSTRDGSKIVGIEGLQDKSARDYFQRAKEVERGRVLIVPVEFNRERGVLEYPLKPVIRLAMPVYDSQDNKVGIAIINYKARVLLDRLFASGKVARGNANILSARGRWLMESAGFQPEDYVLNSVDDLSFATRMPQEWEQIGTSTAGVFRTENGLFSYRVLLPARLGERPSVNPVAWTVPKPGSGAEGGWIVLSHIPTVQLDSILAANRMLPRTSKVLLGLLILTISWLIALQFSGNRVRLEELKTSARSDDLTGLVNRGEFDRNLFRAISLAERNKRPMGVVYIDVNEFKALNDTHGHASGDKVLIAIGERLVKSCRNSDVAARLGGDEFAVILWELAGRADARVAAMGIAARMQKPLHLDHGEYQTSVSIGVALYPDDGTTPEALLAHADQRMYAEKALSKKTANA
ncbi:sensor domain-containing diguanylate cyclase [Congregibacter brevis]|uniref:Sensor domain-containing diguanylate cyclase n=1 Tax=Congregibacter brevis TaxID=3081201 RepID=A0ABZ0IBF9_9GAMM|nr:sensor domain-containing diguanylate cyclase [Congregibacter sp. IMCC45268]